MSEFWELGLEPIAVSAISGTGTGELMEQLMASLPPPKSSESVAAPDAPLAVAIVGRPNVGKSSLLNSLVCLPSYIRIIYLLNLLVAAQHKPE